MMIRFIVVMVCGLIGFIITQYFTGPPVPSSFAIFIGVIVFVIVLIGRFMFDDDLNLDDFDISDFGGD